VLGQGRLDKYAESHAKDFAAHGESHEYNLEEDMAAAKEERKTSPDMKVKVNQILAERDLVAVYWTANGINTQAGMGFPATGKKIKIDGMTIFRFKAGRICEEWSVWDMLSAMRQAGLLRARLPSEFSQPWFGMFPTSIASAASSFLSICGSGLSSPVCSKQCLPASTPHVGQGTASNSCGVRSVILTDQAYCDPYRKTVQIWTT
jgi:steroid delta-isomerase-like uncharacterized protein